jgi:hypothetical protein
MKISNNINTEFIQNIINDYDTITESQEYPYPSRIRKKVKKEHYIYYYIHQYLFY